MLLLLSIRKIKINFIILKAIENKHINQVFLIKNKLTKNKIKKFKHLNYSINNNKYNKQEKYLWIDNLKIWEIVAIIKIVNLIIWIQWEIKIQWMIP